MAVNKATRPLDARQYQPEMWESFEVEVSREPDPVPCSINTAPDRGAEAPMWVVPTQGYETATNPAETMRERANQFTEWVDRFTPYGGSVLVMYSKWFDDFTEMATQIEQGVDSFAHMERRIQAVVSHCIETEKARAGNVLIGGTSRHGFASLHALANSDNIWGAVAHQPVVWWPELGEFKESAVGYRNLILQRHSLYEMIDQMVPKRLPLQTGYMDDRVGQDRLMRFHEMVQRSYEQAGVSDHYTCERMGVPGHSGWIPDQHFDSIPKWLEKQGFVE